MLLPLFRAPDASITRRLHLALHQRRGSKFASANVGKYTRALTGPGRARAIEVSKMNYSDEGIRVAWQPCISLCTLAVLQYDALAAKHSFSFFFSVQYQVPFIYPKDSRPETLDDIPLILSRF